MSNTTRNSEELKMFNSPIYRRRIKRMVEMVKTVRGIHGKLPKGKLPPLKSTATSKEKEKQAQQEAYRLTVDTIHYFANPIINTNLHREASNENSDQP
jgi:hypothetical protein